MSLDAVESWINQQEGYNPLPDPLSMKQIATAIDELRKNQLDLKGMQDQIRELLSL